MSGNLEEIVCGNLRAARLEKGLNKNAVAIEISTNRSNITRWERSTVPTLKNILKLAILYKTTINELIEPNKKDTR